MSAFRNCWRAACRFEARLCHAFELWAGYDFAWRDAWDTAGEWQ